MANRTVSVILQAEIGQYVTGMAKAALATKGVGETAETTGAKATKGFDLAGRGALLFGGAVAGALVGVVAKAMDFEKSMSAVQAATQASAATMGQLREAAIKAGADTQYSATEAADAITEMAKAGVSAKDIMGGGLKGALSLAAAGQLDVADAAGIASTAMTQFSLKGSDLPHVADLLAAGAGKAMGSVDDLGQALNQAGLLASSAGISVEETTGTLAAFASAGLIGSDAGTSFKTMLQQLQAPSKQSAELMQQLGINAYDAQGKFVGISALAQELKDHLGGLSQAQRDNALATIFGTDAARAATVLYREGSAGIKEWTDKVNDSGYAARQAADLNNNLAGDLERLGGSVETLMVSIGQGLMGPLRDLAQMLTGVANGALDAVHAFGNLPGPLQAGIGALGAMALLNGPLSGVLGTLRGFGSSLGSSIGGTFRALGEDIGFAQSQGAGLFTILKGVGSYAAGGLKSALGGLVDFFGGPVGIAIAAIVTSYGMMVNASKDVKVATVDITQAQQGFTQALRDSNGVIDENVRHAAAKAAQDAGVLDLAQKAGVSLSLVTDGLTGNADAYQTVSNRLHDYADAQQIAVGMMSTSTGATVDQIDKAKAQAEQAQATADAFDKLAGTTGKTADQQKQLAAATQGSADAATTAAAQTAAASEAAQKAYDDWISAMAQVGTAFVDPLAIYQEQLQAAAQATADATGNAKDSWKDYADSATVSLDQFAQKLQDQITAQENWHQNLVIVAQRAGYDVATQLEAMGVQGAGLVAQMANSSDAEMQRMAGLLRQDAANGSTGATEALDKGMKVMAAVAAAGAGATAAGISSALGMGINDVAAIAAQYGVTLATGFEPVLGALGKQVHLQVGGATRRGVVGINADGNLYENHQAEIAPGGMRIWAEPETGGEAYIPLAPAKRSRSLSIWQETGKRLGVQGFASGGFWSPSDVPRPSSTAPYGSLVAFPSDATMSTEYDTATDWLKKNMASGDPGGAGVQRWAPLVLRALSMVGQPAGLLDVVLRRMNQESGGNPRAINNWDINAQRGDPSRGLMQTIGSTFRAYHFPGTSSDIYDPLANVLAAFRYAMARYGSLSSAFNRKGGYATGTDFVPETGNYLLHQSEAVLNPKEAQAYRAGIQSREVSGGGSGGGGGPTVVNMTGAEISGRLELGTDGFVRLVDGRINGRFEDMYRQKVYK